MAFRIFLNYDNHCVAKYIELLVERERISNKNKEKDYIKDYEEYELMLENFNKGNENV